MIWPSDTYDHSAFDVGLATLELLTNEDRWVHRRVETVDLLRRELARRQVTVEFTLPPALHERLRVGVEGPWCVPIAVLKKQPLRHFDLREGATPVPILGRHANGRVAAQLLTAAAWIALDAEPSAGLVARLEGVATEPSGAALGWLAGLVRHASSDPAAMTLLADETTGYFLAMLSESWILFALIERPEGRRILKYSYDDPLDFASSGASWSRRVGESLGWQPIVVDIPVPAAARGSSYHAEVVVPEELRISAFIYDQETRELLSTAVEQSVDRAALHAPDTPLDADPVLVVAVYAERSGTPSIAAATSLVTTLSLGIGVTVGDLDTATAGSSAAVVLAGSALFAGIVAQRGEHKLVRDVFVGARCMLGLVALAALAAAAGVAFGASAGARDWIWGTGTCLSAVATASLAVAWLRAKPLRQRQDPPGDNDKVTSA